MWLRNLKDKLLGKVYNQPRALIAVLLDRSVDWAERDDAATYLITYDEPEVEEALFSVASDSTDEDDIAESCGECVAEIWCRKDTLDIDKLRELKAAALKEAVGTISVRKPEWIRSYAVESETRTSSGVFSHHNTLTSCAFLT